MSPEPGGRQPFTVSAPHLMLLVVSVVSVYFVIGFYGKSLDSYRMNQREGEVRQQIAQLEAQNRELQDTVDYLQSDAYLETAARDRLNLARPGDRSVVVIAPSKPALGPPGPPAPPRAAAGVPDAGHLGEWIDLFFGPR